jgi:cation transport protein ChaC
MFKSEKTSPSSILSRELLERESLRDVFLQAAEPGSLWTSEQIDTSQMETMRGVRQDDVWVFANGSLIWNPIFPVVERRTASVHGFHRAFCLSSPIGRGTREQPGLMLGLAAGGSCKGLVLKIGGSDVQAELKLLWRREMLSGSYTPMGERIHYRRQTSGLGFRCGSHAPELRRPAFRRRCRRPPHCSLRHTWL